MDPAVRRRHRTRSHPPPNYSASEGIGGARGLGSQARSHLVHPLSPAPSHAASRCSGPIRWSILQVNPPPPPFGPAFVRADALLTVAADGLAARQWRDMGARTQEEARSFIVSSLRRRLGLVICREFARHRIRRVPYIGVPRAVVERRMQRGQLIGGPQARVPLYVPYADFFQYQAGAGRLAARA